ncbi:hypothetical protein SEEPB962_16092, partial [Salmonella enterica subsp. enterica serovar Paratyphi B str. ATCC 51962]
VCFYIAILLKVIVVIDWVIYEEIYLPNDNTID